MEAASTVAGFYFEACALDELCRLTNSKVALDGKQQRAVDIFQSSTNPNTLSLRGIIQGAARQCAQYFDNMVKNTGDSITEIVNEASGPTGRFMDLLIKTLEGNTIGVELKWQTSHSAMVRWFSATSDKTLFGKGDVNGGAFYVFLQSRRSTYWNYQVPDGAWADSVASTGLDEFLRSRGLINEALVNFLLSKGGNRFSK